MPDLIYREPQPITRRDAQAALSSRDPSQVCEALLGLAFHDPDWEWVESTCLDFSHHSDPAVRGVSATCLGHLARIHRRIHLLLVVPRLRAMLEDPAIRGTAQDALDDIAQFVGSEMPPPRRLTLVGEVPGDSPPAPGLFAGSLTAMVPAGYYARESLTIGSIDQEANVIASTEPLPRELDTRGYGDLQGEALRVEFEGYKEISYGPTTMLGGRPCYVRHFEWAGQHGSPIRQIQVYYVESGLGYSLTATTLAARFEENVASLLLILNGIRINRPMAEAT